MIRVRTIRESPLRCDECGKFVSYADLEKGYAYRKLLTPDSEFSREEYETLCREHKK